MTAERTPPLEVFRHAFEGIAEEMGATLVRSSYTVVIRDLLDFSCALFDGRGHLVAQAAHIPSHLGSMGHALQDLLSKWGEDVRPGDVFITNDPFNGGTHTPDIHIFVPIFSESRLISFAGSIAHHADWGGRVPGTMSAENTTVFEEGVIYPHVKLVEAGRPNQALYDVIEANIRQPALGIGDLRAQVAASRTAARRFEALFDRYSPDQVVAAMEALISYSERRTRNAIAEVADGVYEADGYLDAAPDGRRGPLRIAATVTVQGETMTFDFAGTDPQVDEGINVPLATTRSAVLFAVRSLLDDSVPTTEGCLASIDILAPTGSLVNPVSPAPVSDRHLTSQRIADVLLRCLSKARPDRVSAGWFVGSAWMVCFPRGRKTDEETLLLFNLVGGGGASGSDHGPDGVDAHLSSASLIPAEVIGSEYPLELRRVSLVPGSGGEGARRGGSGIRAEFLNAGTEPVRVQCGMEQSSPEHAPWGLAGGRPGTPGHFARIVPEEDDERAIPSRSSFMLAPGETFVMVTGGGGGHGTPEAGPGSQSGVT